MRTTLCGWCRCTALVNLKDRCYVCGMRQSEPITSTEFIDLVRAVIGLDTLEDNTMAHEARQGKKI